jgi:hypothetical protein
VGRVYQQTVIDTYSKVGFAKLYTRKTPLTAADIANFPRQRRRRARKAEPSKGCIVRAPNSFDPADTHHARSTVRQIK